MIQIILFNGSKGKLVEKMAEVCKCDMLLCMDFTHKYFTFLTDIEERIERLEQQFDAFETKVLTTFE